MTNDIPIKRLSKKEMQELFHKCNFLERIARQEFTMSVKNQSHADPSKSGQVFCTYSQIVSYSDDEVEVLRAHRYLLPNNTLGASGMPDPVRIFDGQTIHKLQRK
jgi:hypothetical protein